MKDNRHGRTHKWMKIVTAGNQLNLICNMYHTQEEPKTNLMSCKDVRDPPVLYYFQFAITPPLC